MASFAKIGAARRMPTAVNGLTLLVVLALAVGLFVAYRAGIVRGRRETPVVDRSPLRPAVVAAETAQGLESAAPAATPGTASSSARIPGAADGRHDSDGRRRCRGARAPRAQP